MSCACAESQRPGLERAGLSWGGAWAMGRGLLGVGRGFKGAGYGAGRGLLRVDGACSPAGG